MVPKLGPYAFDLSIERQKYRWISESSKPVWSITHYVPDTGATERDSVSQKRESKRKKKKEKGPIKQSE